MLFLGRHRGSVRARGWFYGPIRCRLPLGWYFTVACLGGMLKYGITDMSSHFQGEIYNSSCCITPISITVRLWIA